LQNLRLRQTWPKMLRTSCALLILLVCVVTGQQNEYAEYARGAGRGRAKKQGGGGLLVAAITGVAGSFVGGWLQQGRMKKRHEKEKKDLLKYIQNVDDVYKQRESQWQAEYSKLYKAYESLESETAKRDYEEFKAPDLDGDDNVSREEFATYVRKYLASFPELSEKDFPQFDAIDINGDGKVSFAEWQQYLKEQKLREATGKGKSSGGEDNAAYSELLKALYEQTYTSKNFDSLSEKIDSNKKGGKRYR